MAAGDIIYAGTKSDVIYRMTGFTSSLRDSIDVSGYATDPWGVTMDADLNLIWTDDDYGTEKAWKEDGFSVGADDSIAMDGTNTSPCDCKWYDGNLYNADNVTDRVNKYTGFTSTVSSYVDLAGRDPVGMTIDDSGNLIIGDITSGYVYRYSGFTNTLDTSFQHADQDPSGLDWYDGNLYSVDVYGDTAYKHNGFSAATTSSFATTAADPAGMHYELSGGAAGLSMPVAMRYYRNMRES